MIPDPEFKPNFIVSTNCLSPKKITKKRNF